MSELPVELVQEIIESSARMHIRNDVRWVGQSLAVACRAIYSLVAPILLETVYISTAEKVLAFYIFAAKAPACLKHTRRFIVHDQADWPLKIWADNANFRHAFAAQITTFSGRHTVLQTLVESPDFHPRTAFVVGKLPRRQSAFSSLTRLCLSNLEVIPGGVIPVTLFPELTHLIILSLYSDQLSLFFAMLSFPKLQRFLVLEMYPNPQRLIEELRRCQDERIYSLPYRELIPLPSSRVLTVADVALRERDGVDVWNSGTCMPALFQN
ncbi:hypothetical protein EXIGLDRAFT_728029 [Exidia glandulosa HHB12029]|uniref:F-box domain-containing protein n=1 Tax=Exidia glandulosa HHB12029 TaxID=1314781 RepID=A0A165D3Z8_EXIGL|nr:hypothetical protein EXIGLDRAFT_728029 [Exidia glandulosa HHB12029]